MPKVHIKNIHQLDFWSIQMSMMKWYALETDGANFDQLQMVIDNFENVLAFSNNFCEMAHICAQVEMALFEIALGTLEYNGH